MRSAKSILPGLITLFIVGALARLISALLPVMNHLLLAILIGVLIGNWYGVPQWIEPGLATHKLWLEAGIVVMGASVALDRVVAAGPLILLLVVVTVISTILLVEVLARGIFQTEAKIQSLLAAGSSICGVSAVVAIAAGIKASEREIAYAAATILLFDAVTLFVYPILGQALGLSDTVFGIWTGLTMFSTGPVAAAGFSFSKQAGEWAVLVKLTRNAFIGVVAICYSVYYTRWRENEATKGTSSTSWRYLWRSFPKFVLGFLFVILIANIGVLSQEQVIALEHASNWLFLFAFAGLGFEIQFSELRSTGIQPILLVLITLVLMSASLLLILDIIL